MYETFFGLQERPFDLAPNPKYLFLSTRQREALSAIRYALEGPRGLMLMAGDAGTGKTTLVQAAIAEIGSVTTQCVLVSNPTLTRSEFYECLAREFGLQNDAGESKTRFLFELRHHLEERHRDGKLTAIVFDEAQSLPHELLEEVRLLSNIETPTTKFLSVVLAGQPELAARLNEPQLRQLKQRIALRCELAAFDLPETAAYIAGRIRIAGGAPADIFTRNAVEAIFEGSSGVPRVINVVSHNALISGFATQSRPIRRTIVEEVLRDLDLAAPQSISPDPHATSPDRVQPKPAAAPAPVAPPPAPEPDSDKSHDDRQGSPFFKGFARKRGFSFF
jgi:general secretion pathway protein A